MATTHPIVTRDPDNLRCRFDPALAPVASVAEHESIVLETAHAFALFPPHETPEFLAALRPLDLDQSNPLTGPIEIVGAEPGDTVVVRIDSIDVDSRVGLSPILDEVGVLIDKVRAPHVGAFAIAEDTIELPGRLRAPLRPNIGVLGVCPGAVQRSVDSGCHGGNLDDPSIAPGARVYLPVAVPGAMLALGDVHGRQGDAEWRAPLEVDATVKLTVERIAKGVQRDCIWTETDTHWIAYGIADSVWRAIDAAAERAVDLLVECCSIGPEHALEALSSIADIRLCTVTEDGWKSVVRVELPNSVDAGAQLRLL